MALSVEDMQRVVVDGQRLHPGKPCIHIGAEHFSRNQLHDLNRCASVLPCAGHLVAAISATESSVFSESQLRLLGLIDTPVAHDRGV